MFTVSVSSNNLPQLQRRKTRIYFDSAVTIREEKIAIIVPIADETVADVSPVENSLETPVEMPIESSNTLFWDYFLTPYTEALVSV